MLLRWLAYATMAICAALLTAGLWPGHLAQFYSQLWNWAFAWLWILSPLLLPLALGLMLGLAVWLWRFPPQGFRAFPTRPVTAAALTVAVTAILLMLQVPQRIGLLLSRHALQAQLDTIDRSRQQPQVSLNQQLGIYQVEAYSVDYTGEVYFHTATSEVPGLISGQRHHGLLYSRRPERRSLAVNGLATTYLGGGWYLYTAQASYFHRWHF